MRVNLGLTLGALPVFGQGIFEVRGGGMGSGDGEGGWGGGMGGGGFLYKL